MKTIIVIQEVSSKLFFSRGTPADVIGTLAFARTFRPATAFKKAEELNRKLRVKALFSSRRRPIKKHYIVRTIPLSRIDAWRTVAALGPFRPAV